MQVLPCRSLPHYVSTHVTNPQSEVKVLEAIKTMFNLLDAGNVSLKSISLNDLQAIYEEMVIPQEKLEE